MRIALVAGGAETVDEELVFVECLDPGHRRRPRAVGRPRQGSVSPAVEAASDRHARGGRRPHAEDRSVVRENRPERRAVRIEHHLHRARSDESARRRRRTRRHRATRIRERGISRLYSRPTRLSIHAVQRRRQTSGPHWREEGGLVVPVRPATPRRARREGAVIHLPLPPARRPPLAPMSFTSSSVSAAPWASPARDSFTHSRRPPGLVPCADSHVSDAPRRVAHSRQRAASRYRGRVSQRRRIGGMATSWSDGRRWLRCGSSSGLGSAP